MSNVAALRNAIRDLHGCDSKHVGSVPVKETFQGVTVWDGTVEVFDLIGHPAAKRCYAWFHTDGPRDEKRRYVAVLELPPVDSPKTAVQVAIASQFRNDS